MNIDNVIKHTIHCVGENHDEKENAYQHKETLLKICQSNNIKTAFMEFLLYPYDISFSINEEDKIVPSVKMDNPHTIVFNKNKTESPLLPRLKNIIKKYTTDKIVDNKKMWMDIFREFNAIEIEEVETIFRKVIFQEFVSDKTGRMLTANGSWRQQLDCIKYLLQNNIDVVGIETQKSYKENNGSNGATDERIKIGNEETVKVIEEHSSKESEKNNYMLIYGMGHFLEDKCYQNDVVPVQKQLEQKSYNVKLYTSVNNFSSIQDIKKTEYNKSITSCVKTNLKNPLGIYEIDVLNSKSTLIDENYKSAQDLNSSNSQKNYYIQKIDVTHGYLITHNDLKNESNAILTYKNEKLDLNQLDESDKLLKENFDEVIKNTANQLKCNEDVVRKFLENIGKYAITHKGSGKNAGFSVWKNNESFKEIMGITRDNLAFQSRISATWQIQSFKYFDTVLGRKYPKNEDQDIFGARSFRAGMLYVILNNLLPKNTSHSLRSDQKVIN